MVTSLFDFLKVKEVNILFLERCHKLYSIEIPSSVNKIGTNAFKECTNLKYVTYYGNNEPTYVSNVFDSNSPLEYVYVSGLYMNNDFCGIPIKFINIHTEPIRSCYKFPRHVIYF